MAEQGDAELEAARQELLVKHLTDVTILCGPEPHGNRLFDTLAKRIAKGEAPRAVLDSAFKLRWPTDGGSGCFF